MTDMPAHTQLKTVLVISHDPRLADVRKSVLEAAGYEVLSVSNLTDIETTCKNKKVHLTMIGYSLPPAEKRRMFMEAREHCKTPVLELYQNGKPELMEESHISSHLAKVPEDFLEAVNALLRST
jgi:DNA-binding NtrC family response regulator